MLYHNYFFSIIFPSKSSSSLSSFTISPSFSLSFFPLPHHSLYLLLPSTSSLHFRTKVVVPFIPIYYHSYLYLLIPSTSSLVLPHPFNHPFPPRLFLYTLPFNSSTLSLLSCTSLPSPQSLSFLTSSSFHLSPPLYTFNASTP